MYFVVYLVAHNAQAGGIVRFGVHELGPTELSVLTYFDDVLQGGLDEGVQEVDEVVVVTVEEDVAEGEIAVADTNGHSEFGEAVEYLL